MRRSPDRTFLSFAPLQVLRRHGLPQCRHRPDVRGRHVQPERLHPLLLLAG